MFTAIAWAVVYRYTFNPEYFVILPIVADVAFIRMLVRFGNRGCKS